MSSNIIVTIDGYWENEDLAGFPTEGGFFPIEDDLGVVGWANASAPIGRFTTAGVTVDTGDVYLQIGGTQECAAFRADGYVFFCSEGGGLIAGKWLGGNSLDPLTLGAMDATTYVQDPYGCWFIDGNLFVLSSGMEQLVRVPVQDIINGDFNDPPVFTPAENAVFNMGLLTPLNAGNPYGGLTRYRNNWLATAWTAGHTGPANIYVFSDPINHELIDIITLPDLAELRCMTLLSNGKLLVREMNDAAGRVYICSITTVADVVAAM
jgi:hypothetical protein